MRNPTTDELMKNIIVASGVLTTILLGAADLHRVGLT